MKRLSRSILRDRLLSIYITSVCPHLDYGDIIYNKPGKVNFESKLNNSTI